MVPGGTGNRRQYAYFLSKKPSSTWKAEAGMPAGSLTIDHGALSSKAML
eukprot:CAMPEP_0117496718 /NCGR_PEP_ID=MMETSP0784-20121206/20802_1 /TAXON_ID=39447 /ORGANISM="" /LENGTH=48 /DNA_ID= /DNA_START= /DNA_END= /DNA_ORIENTATION=